MNQSEHLNASMGFQRPSGRILHPGDLLIPRADYPILCEVITVEARGLLRIRGTEWDPGYSAEVSVEEMHPVSSILTR